MDRKDLNETERRALTKLVSALFEGAVIALPDSKAGVKFLCFRMDGELLPEVPLGRPARAADNSLFISGESYVAGRVDSRTWLGTGPLDEILVTLNAFGGDVRQMLNRFLHESATRAAMGVKIDKIFDLSQSPMQQVVQHVDYSARADAEFEAYEFGEDCQVVGTGGWASSSSGDSAEFTRMVYVRYSDDEAGADSHKVGFTVRFNGGELVDAFACEQRHGNEIGQRGKPAPERPRG